MPRNQCCDDSFDRYLSKRVTEIELTLMREGVLTHQNYYSLKQNPSFPDPNPPPYDSGTPQLSLISRLQLLEKDNRDLKARMEQLEKAKETS
jgi:hypothetical protein